jgi:hypothetical protein
MRVGDELTVGGRHPGDEERRGEIIQVYGSDGAPPYLVRWREGDESVVFVRYGSPPGLSRRVTAAKD